MTSIPRLRDLEAALRADGDILRAQHGTEARLSYDEAADVCAELAALKSRPVRVRESVTLAQAHAEDTAWAARGANFGVSFKQGHRKGWADFADWILAPQLHAGIHYEARCTAVFLWLLSRGVLRSVQDVDNAIHSAREALHADEYVWLDPDSDAAWGVLEPVMYRFLDLTDTELAVVA